MNILFAIKSLGIAGGAERVLTEVTCGLVERGHRVSILTYDPPNENLFYPLHPSLSLINLSIGASKQRTTIKETLERMVALRRTIVNMKPDVVVGFMNSMFIPISLALSGTNFPVIASEHIGVEYYRKHPIEHFLLQLTPFLTKRITIISEKLRNDFNIHLRKHMTVIPNPVNMAKENIVNSARSNDARNQILCVGRLVSQKDHKTLIKAFAKLAADFPGWDLKIIGEGELRSQLENQIKSLGLKDRIQIASTTANISEEYLDSRIFVVPSLFESFGLVTAEALAYGLPVVGFADCPGTNELIKQDQNGILVQGVQRSAVLSNGIRRLIKSPELRQRLGDAGPESVADFSRERICTKWEELLEISK